MGRVQNAKFRSPLKQVLYGFVGSLLWEEQEVPLHKTSCGFCEDWGTGLKAASERSPLKPIEVEGPYRLSYRYPRRIL